MIRKLKILLPVSVGLLLLLIIVSLFGIKLQFTTGLSRDSLLKVGGNTCSLAEGRLYLANMLEIYKSTYGDELLEQDFSGITAEDFLKENTVAKLSKIKLLNKMADKWKVELDKDEKSLAKKAADLYWDELGREKAKKLDIGKKDLEKMYQEYLLAEKTFDFLTNGDEVEVSEDEARIIVVWHIYFKTYDRDEAGNITDYSNEDKELVLAKADKAKEELASGADFAEIAKNYSDDPAYEYEIGRGEMPEEFDEAAFNLESGEISDIVETPYGFHIIKCISDFEEGKTKLNKECLLEERQFEEYEALYNEYAEDKVAILNEKAWKKVTLESVDIGTGSFFEILEELKKTEA